MAHNLLNGRSNLYLEAPEYRGQSGEHGQGLGSLHGDTYFPSRSARQTVADQRFAAANARIANRARLSNEAERHCAQSQDEGHSRRLLQCDRRAQGEERGTTVKSYVYVVGELQIIIINI